MNTEQSQSAPQKFTPLIIALILWMILMNVFVIMQADMNSKLIKIQQLQTESVRLLNDKLNNLKCPIPKANVKQATPRLN
jgi:F0F1-type ATP synthase membrane subunit a